MDNLAQQTICLVVGIPSEYNSKEKANLFNEQFSKVFSNPDEPSPSFSNINTNSNIMNNIEISKKRVLKLLQGINENKATGPNDIPGKVLKICSYELHKIFTILYQSSLNCGKIPDEWKKAHIFPLFKKDVTANKSKTGLFQT